MFGPQMAYRIGNLLTGLIKYLYYKIFNDLVNRIISFTLLLEVRNEPIN